MYYFYQNIDGDILLKKKKQITYKKVLMFLLTGLILQKLVQNSLIRYSNRD